MISLYFTEQKVLVLRDYLSVVEAADVLGCTGKQQRDFAARVVYRQRKFITSGLFIKII